MKRTIILRAASVILEPGGRLDPGTSPYSDTNTPSKKLYEVWNNPAPVNGEYAYFTGTIYQQESGVGFERPPTLAAFNKVTITAGFDYSQAHGPEGPPGPWYFPPDNAAGPGVTLMLRKRDKTTWLDGTGTAAYRFLDSDDNNVNINTNPNYKLHTLTWEMTSHPEGGPWTIEDITYLGVAARGVWSPGPNGKAYDPAGHAFHKIRVPYLTVTLDVEDLGGYVGNVRHAASLTLRLMRRARNAIMPVTLAEHAVGKVGSRVYLSHPRGPAVGGAGWGRRRLERRAGLVLAREYILEEFKVEDEVLDLRPISCLGWAAYRIDGAWSPELQGLALIDKGKGIEHVRAQDAWSQRPGDGVLMRVLPDYSNLSFEGLAVAGGGDVSVALRNYDLMQSGWSTVGSAGDFAAAADTTVAMAEEQGYLSSCRLTYGAGGGTGGRERSLGALGAGVLHVRVRLKNTSVPSPGTQHGEWYLRRATDYWNEGTRAWVGSPVYNAVPSDAPSGEAIADAIPATAATYHVGVGRFSSAMGPVTLHGAVVDVQHSDATVAGARPPLITLDATIARVADSHQMPQVWGRELWSHERGTAVVEVRPWWRAASLPADAVKPLLHAQHAAGTWDALQFVTGVTGDRPAIHWTFDESSGPRLDSVGIHDLTEYGGTIGAAAGIVGNAAQLDSGRSFYVDAAPLPQPPANFTITAWVWLDAKPANQMGIATKWDPSFNNRQYALIWDNTLDCFIFAVSSDGTGAGVGEVDGTNFPAPTLGRWHFVAAYHDSVNDLLGISVDGEPVQTQPWTTGVFAAGASALNVAVFAPGQEWQGRMDEVRFYNSALTLEQIRAAMLPTSTNFVRFERGISGEATYQLDCPIVGIDLTRAHVLRAWCRWLGADGWTEYSPFSVEVGYAIFLATDGSLVGTGSALGRLTSETAVPYARDYLGVGCDATRQLDGWIRMWETRRAPLHRLEAVWKV